MAYRVYLTDALQLLGENVAVTAHRYGAEGRYITARYHDILHPKPEETRTAEEIIAHVTSKLKGGAG